MSLQARRIGETQAQYRRRVGTKRPQTVNPGLNRQKVERVSVMPQDMKATDRGSPVTKIGGNNLRGRCTRGKSLSTKLASGTAKKLT